MGLGAGASCAATREKAATDRTARTAATALDAAIASVGGAICGGGGSIRIGVEKISVVEIGRAHV